MSNPKVFKEFSTDLVNVKVEFHEQFFDCDEGACADEVVVIHDDDSDVEVATADEVDSTRRLDFASNSGVSDQHHSMIMLMVLLFLLGRNSVR